MGDKMKKNKQAKNCNSNKSCKGNKMNSNMNKENTNCNANTSSNYAIYTREITSISIKNNLVWSDIINTNCGMLRYSTAPTGTAMDNYAYIKTESTNDKGGLYSWQICFGGNSGLFTGAEQFEILRDTADPFSGGTFNLSTGEFQPSSEYSDYGAQR